MEILIITVTLLSLTAVAILVATRGKPMRFFSAFGDTLTTFWQNRVPLFGVAVCMLLVLAFLYLFYYSPAMQVQPAQPIAFSHRLHSGHKAIDCYYCHPYVERSLHPGLPPVEKCLHCHNYIIANHPEIRKEHNYYDTQTPTPWRKVYYLAEHVLFNHQRHIKREIACEKCHGEVKQMDRLKSHHFYMGFCVECHQENKANLDCWLACHS